MWPEKENGAPVIAHQKMGDDDGAGVFEISEFHGKVCTSHNCSLQDR
jgi:hypothetical protein